MVTMIAYIGLVYAFLSDTFILNEKMVALEVVGVVLILLMNILLILYQSRKQCTKVKDK